MPGAAMRAEERVESGELKPACIKFARKFPRRDEPAGVGAPEWRHTERIVESHRYVSRQGLPARFHVAGPNPAAVTGHPSEAVAMQTPGADIWAIQQRSFIIATMASQPRFDRQFIAVVGPPAVHAQREILAMAGPVITDVKWGSKIFGRVV